MSWGVVLILDWGDGWFENFNFWSLFSLIKACSQGGSKGQTKQKILQFSREKAQKIENLPQKISVNAPGLTIYLVFKNYHLFWLKCSLFLKIRWFSLDKMNSSVKPKTTLILPLLLEWSYTNCVNIGKKGGHTSYDS